MKKDTHIEQICFIKHKIIFLKKENQFKGWQLNKNKKQQKTKQRSKKILWNLKDKKWKEKMKEKWKQKQSIKNFERV